jgi:hypothetical protein
LPGIITIPPNTCSLPCEFLPLQVKALPAGSKYRIALEREGNQDSFAANFSKLLRGLNTSYQGFYLANSSNKPVYLNQENQALRKAGKPKGTDDVRERIQKQITFCHPDLKNNLIIPGNTIKAITQIQPILFNALPDTSVYKEKVRKASSVSISNNVGNFLKRKRNSYHGFRLID